MLEARQGDNIFREPRGRGTPCGVTLIFVWLVVLFNLVPDVLDGARSAAVSPTVDRVDPNVAPWWELTILPRIGEQTARQIVRYRRSVTESSNDSNDARAFRHAADLERIRGIGPRTVQRMARYLRF